MGGGVHDALRVLVINRDNPKLSTILNFRLFTRKVFEFTRKLVRIPGDFQVKNKCRILTLDNKTVSVPKIRKLLEKLTRKWCHNLKLSS